MKILCVSTLTNVGSLHYKREMTILQALRQRGAQIDYVYCGGMEGVCDGLGSINPQRCIACRNNAEQQALEAGLVPRILLADETLAERQQAAQWAASLADDELVKAQYDGLHLGRWCLSSVFTYWRLPEISAHDAQALKWYRALLHQGLRLSLGMEKILDRTQYDLVIIYNCRMAYVKIPFELSRRRGLNVYSHERGRLPGYCCVALNSVPFSNSNWVKLWNTWENIPLTAPQLGKVAEYLHNRKQGDPKALNWYSFTGKPGQADALRERLGIAVDKTIWALFTSSNHEISGRDDLDIQGFASQQDWIEKAVVKAAAYPNVKLVIRAHPNLTSIADSRSAERELVYFSFLKRSVGSSAIVIEPEEDVSSYDLMELASVALCYRSTCGWEMAAMGKPVAIASNPIYACLPQLDKIYSEEEMERVFARYAALPPGYRDPELQRMAYRLWYIYLFRHGFEFPYVHTPTPIEGRYAWFSPDHLRPGVSKHLDVICDAMFSGQFPFIIPSPENLALDSADEEAFWGGDAPPRPQGEPSPASAAPRYMTIPVLFVATGAASQSARALNALAANTLASDTDLQIVCSAGHDWRRLADLPKQAQAFRSVTLQTVETDEGLCAIVVKALTKTLAAHESAIVFDDGLYSAPQALALLNNALFRYRYRSAVGCVCAAANGQVPKHFLKQTSDVIFAPGASGLGLGVWRDRWNALKPETVAGLQSGPADHGTERQGLQRLVAALCADRKALCAVPVRPHACPVGPEGAACRKEFVHIPKEHAMPFAPELETVVVKARHDPASAADGSAEIRRHLEEFVGRMRDHGAPVLINLGCGGHFHADWINLDMNGDFAPVIPWNLLTALPLPDQSCDAVYSCHSLEHFHPQDARRVLAECHRVLRPGGILRVVVPDLEDQARAYLRSLDEARQAPEDLVAAARHEWMLVELLDQMARHEGGGQMAQIWAREPLAAESLIVERMGREFLSSRAVLRGRPEPATPPRDPARVGAFRLGGEVHQWMYDQVSLQRLLRACGFKTIQQKTAHESNIQDFSRYLLDVLADKTVYRPGSLYMEAIA